MQRVLIKICWTFFIFHSFESKKRTMKYSTQCYQSRKYTVSCKRQVQLSILAQNCSVDSREICWEFGFFFGPISAFHSSTVLEYKITFLMWVHKKNMTLQSQSSALEQHQNKSSVVYSSQFGFTHKCEHQAENNISSCLVFTQRQQYLCYDRVLFANKSAPIWGLSRLLSVLTTLMSCRLLLFLGVQ